MREVNFSIPNVNKASVGITTALYDRRALDSRIRDILCVDGGVERLVCILKQGRSKEMMEMWKWNLAFQCVVNIGVRGSEQVRTRVVEADMVPVIATLLDNYIQVIDHCREKAVDLDARRSRLPSSRPASRSFRESSSRPSGHERGSASADFHTLRRQPPPAIEIPQTLHQAQAHSIDGTIEVPTNPPQLALISPQEPSPFARQPLVSRNSDPRSPGTRALPSRNGLQAPAALTLSTDGDMAGLRPVRDAERLPSMLPSSRSGLISQPESPTTPSAPVSRSRTSAPEQQRRASRRTQQSSASGDSDDGLTDVNNEDRPTALADTSEDTMVDINPTVNIENGEDEQTMLGAVDTPMDLSTENGSEGQEATAFTITHRTALDGSIITTNLTPTTDTTATMALRQTQPQMQPMTGTSPTASHNLQGRYMLDRSVPPGVLAATPRDEDVLMSLQLLAYVSKYCNLRTYFQHSHLVPKLKIERHLKALNEGSNTPVVEESNEEEYLLPDDYNIFPLVEKFTVRHHSQDMQYWAGVVMRNLCRKDDSRGGIRQCAYYKCGRWEQWTRQFAKCRRCRRTKYCSKECQKNAWVYHRHWCQMATQ